MRGIQDTIGMGLFGFLAIRWLKDVRIKNWNTLLRKYKGNLLESRWQRKRNI